MNRPTRPSTPLPPSEAPEDSSIEGPDDDLPPIPPRRPPSRRPPPAAPDMSEPIGRAGGYELLIELAIGGMASVYLARSVAPVDDSPAARSLVAIKRPHRHLATDAMYAAMLLDEARLASAIDHPHVVRVRELGYEGKEPFIVMDYVEGASLAELRKELAAAERAVDGRVAVKIALDALAGLHAAHELNDPTGKPLGIIHRDVSPHNVLLGTDGRVRLTDFGIAKAEDRVQVTRTHEVKGKLAYLAPERVDRRRLCTRQSDVFSMAVVLWECIAGRRLFRGDEAVDILDEVMHAPLPRLRQLGADVPDALDTAIARGLARELKDRYATAADFADAIRSAVGSVGIGSEEDVSRMVDAVFGPRLRARHESLRRLLGESTADDLLRASGMTPRQPGGVEELIASPLMLAAVAPPAPSDRYAFGRERDGSGAIGRRPSSRRVAAVVLGALVTVGGLTALVVTSGRRGDASHGVGPAPSASAGATGAGATGAGATTSRRVVVSLPFAVTHVSFDDVDRDVDPPSDVIAFQVPPSSGARHRVVAIAGDGSRVEGIVREEDGVAQAEEPGFLVAPAVTSSAPAIELGDDPAPATAPASATPPRPRPPPPRPPPPVGTLRNGFTKLK